MSFAVTAFRARGVRIDGAQPDRAIQQAIIQVTATTADVDMDIGDDSGTFWTAAEADTTAVGGTTYGAIASAALDALQVITDQAQTLSRWYIPELIARVQAAAASGAAYSVATAEKRPNITFDAANGVEAATVILEWILNPGVLPLDVVYNVSPA